MSRLKDSFEFVRKEFFPRWDNKKEWLVKEVNAKESFQGRCERARKTLVIRNLPHNLNSLYFLLIHEICHAVSTDSHGRRWKNRMSRVSELAQKKGNSQLSKMILYDLEKLNKFGDEREVKCHG